MRALSAILLTAFLIALSVDVSGVSNSPHLTSHLFDPTFASGGQKGGLGNQNLKEVFSFPVRLELSRQQALAISLDSPGSSITGRLELILSGKGPAYVNYGDEWLAMSFGNKKCKPVPEKTGSPRYLCRFVVTTDGRKPLWVNINPKTNHLTVHKVSFVAAKAKRISALSGNIVFAAFIFLAVMGPLFVKVRQVGHLEYLSFIFLSGLFLYFLNPATLVFILGFLLAIFGLVQALIKAEAAAKKFWLYVILAAIVLSIILVKILFPHLADIFANPGGFWLVLPLGFSYFAIRLVDLALNAYSGSVERLSLVEYLAFMLFPATLPAGPIYTIDQFREAHIDHYDSVDYAAGLARLFVGITKKMLADHLVLPLVLKGSNSFIAAPEQLGGVDGLVFLGATTLFVLLDFSAYSDIAIGTGRSMGWRVPENFNFPLLRANLRTFWQNWHMTLSNWVMRRVFMTSVMTSRSVTLSTLASMMTIGLWHSLGLSWFFWAVHHTMMLIVEQKLVVPRFLARIEVRSQAIRTLFAGMRYMLGVMLVWFWVSLGHAFTSFSNIEMAFELYFRIITAPFWFLVSLFG